MDEKVGVASGPSGVVIGGVDMVPMGKRTRDDQNGDAVRVERLKSSIDKIRDQIEQTRKELDGVCMSLRELSTNDGQLISGSATGGTVVDTSATSQATNLTNEELLEEARAMVNGHVKMLTRYNELKDVAMVLFELLAQYEGVRVGDVLRDRGVEVDD